MVYEGYFIEEEYFERLRAIEKRLHGGSDAMRDEGHKLLLVIEKADHVRLYPCGEEWELIEEEVR